MGQGVRVGGPFAGSLKGAGLHLKTMGSAWVRAQVSLRHRQRVEAAAEKSKCTQVSQALPSNIRLVWCDLLFYT